MEQKTNKYIADMREAYVRYLTEHCHLKDRTLIHYPDAVDKYIPRFIRIHIDSKFDNFYIMSVDNIKNIYNQLQKSNDWEKEIQRKTWNLRLKAVEYFISFRASI